MDMLIRWLGLKTTEWKKTKTINSWKKWTQIVMDSWES
jgi:hypothetical protein